MKFKTPDVMGFLRGIAADLRKKHVWPIAALLLAAIVAVPVLLSKSSSPAPVAQAPQTSTPPPAAAIPAVSEQTVSGPSRLTGKARNPFTQQSSGTTTATTTSTAAAPPVSTATATSTASATNSSSSTTSSSSGGSSSTSSSGGSSTPANPPAPAPSTKPKPQTGLTSTQSYGVTLSITNPSGGLNSVDPLQRLTVLPSQRQPLVVELGVLRGGHRVLFVVRPGTAVTGPGVCTPGRVDCQIVSLAPHQRETLETQSPTGPASIAEFAVTGITVDKHSSVASANRARRTASAAGRSLLAQSSLSALSLFRYEPSVGAVVDLRNLTVSRAALASPSAATTGPGASSGQLGTPPALQVGLQLLPQGLQSALSSGLAVRVTSNQQVNGIASVSISRAAAQRAHLKVARGSSVVIGRGTVPGIGNGAVGLHLHLSRSVVKSLAQLRHLTMTVRMTFVAAGGAHMTIDAAGRD